MREPGAKVAVASVDEYDALPFTLLKAGELGSVHKESSDSCYRKVTHASPLTSGTVRSGLWPHILCRLG